MTKGYVFISNSTKPSLEKANSRLPISPGNVSRPCITAAIENGYEVYLGVNRNNPEELSCDLPVHLFDSHTYRSITAFKDNFNAYKNLCKIMENNNIEAIHCNTPVGGMIGRICAHKYHVKHVIYTAHGFHFYKGAPLINRTIYKWAEQIMAHWTDVIITMNQEDYDAAKTFKLRNGGKVFKVHGVGIDTSRYQRESIAKEKKRQELQISADQIVIISVGELNENKNLGVIIEAIKNIPNVHYLLCGVGPLKDQLQKSAESIGDRVHFLGYRNDIRELLAASDIFVMPSFREGLSRSLMEAMAVGLPAVASEIRGNADLIKDGKGGYLCGVNDVNAYCKAITTLAKDEVMRNRMGIYNANEIKNYDIGVVKKEIKEIYREVLV